MNHTEESYLTVQEEGSEPSGLPMNWPSYIQKSRPITESMVFIVSDSLVDLNFLQGTTGRPVRSGTCSELERLADVISTGEGRDIEAAVASAPVRYSTSVVKFTLEPPPRVPASSVPAPEDTREWKRLEGVESPKDLQSMMTAMSLYDADLATEKSIFGHARRVAQKIPPCVWVVNQHTEVIKVAVSQFGSYRKVTDVGVDASATGVGFNLSLAVSPIHRGFHFL